MKLSAPAIFFAALLVTVSAGFAALRQETQAGPGNTTPVQARGRGRNNPPPAPTPPPEVTPTQIAQEGMKLLKGHADGILSLAFSPDGKLLASASADHSIILWNIADGTVFKKLEGHHFGVSAICFSPDGKKLLSGGYDAAADIWDIATGQIEFRCKDDGPVLHAAFLGDSNHFATAWGSDVHMWHTGEDTPLQNCTCDGPVAGMVFTPKGELITVDQGAGLIVWNPKDGEKTAHFTRPRANRPMVKDQDNNWLIGVSLLADGNVLLDDVSGFWTWDRKNDKFTWIGKNLYNLAGSFGADAYYAGGMTGKLLWIREMDPAGVSFALWQDWKIHAIALSPNGDYLAFAGGGEYTPRSAWRTAGPMDVRVLRTENIIKGLKADKQARAEKLNATRQQNPTTEEVLDTTALDPKDGEPLPWQKLF